MQQKKEMVQVAVENQQIENIRQQRSCISKNTKSNEIYVQKLRDKLK